jgi:signal transduction histidine kinase
MYPKLKQQRFEEILSPWSYKWSYNMESVKYTVLLVDDEKLDQQLTIQALAKARFIQRIQFKVETAQTLSEAMRLLGMKSYDVILLDLGLPDSQGLDAVKEVRTANLQSAVVVLTGLADEELGLEAIKEGADDYVIKGGYLEHVLVRIVRYAIKRKEVEEKLRKANEKLKEEDELKNEFISMVSHELRTPLSIFKNVISNALAGVFGQMSPKLKDNLKMMDESIDRLGRIIDNFLDISIIEAGRMEINRRDLNLVALVREVVDSFHRLAEDKDVELQGIIPEVELIVNADRDKIIQVLTNLIGNAMKFVPARKARINVYVKDLGNEVEVDVEDNGVGIDKDDIGKIFQRFTRIEKTAAETHGTGLGLSISKQLIEMQDGRIWVESTPGKGSIFCFALPKSGTAEKNFHREKQGSVA